jgi:hypothetical protein
MQINKFQLLFAIALGLHYRWHWPKIGFTSAMQINKFHLLFAIALGLHYL